MILEKACSRCYKTKPVEEFYKQKCTKSGFHSWCKQCNKEYLIEWRKINGCRRILEGEQYEAN